MTAPMTKTESIAYLRKLALKERLSEDFFPTHSEGAEEVFLELEKNSPVDNSGNGDIISP